MRSCSFEKRLRMLEAGRDLRGKRASIPSFPGWLAAELSSEPNLMTQVGVSNADNPWQYEALPAQRSFHSDLGSRFKGYSGPVGSGKSHALVYEALFLSRLNPGLLGLIGAPTYPMLRDSTQRTFFEVLQQERIEYTFHKQENKVRFLANGSEVIFRTLENPDRLRGPNLAWFAIDELTYAREDAWTRLLARLRHPAARRLCGCAVWTPNGYDWVHRRFLESKAPDYRVVLATPRENTHLPPDFYDQLQGSYSERFYRQEVLGEYLDMAGGNAYYAFSEKNIQPMKYDPHLPLCWALDFNVDPLCSVICQIEERKDLAAMRVGQGRTIKVLRVLDEIVLADSNTVEAATEFLRRIEDLDSEYGQQLISVYGDASGNSRTTKSSRTDYELIREVFRRRPEFRLEMKANTANPAVKDRVNTVNALLCNASRERNLLISPTCHELIKDLRQVKWKRDGAGNPMGELDKSDPQRTHASDALSYCVAREFGLRPPVGALPYSIV